MEQNEMLLQLRKAHRLSQAELAAELGIARQTVSRWEAGLAAPSSENLIGLSRLYGLPVEEIYRTGRAERQEDAAEPAPEPEEPAEPAPEPLSEPEDKPGRYRLSKRAAFLTLLSVFYISVCIWGVVTNSRSTARACLTFVTVVLVFAWILGELILHIGRKGK